MFSNRTQILGLIFAASLLSLSGCSEKAKPVPVFQMGEHATVGRLVYTAFDTQWLTQIGQGTTARIPQNRFFVIRMSITNGAGGSVTVPNFTLEDDHGGSFTELSDGSQLPQWMGALKLVNPADSLQGTILFDVVPAHYRLRVLDENNQNSALIDIPLSINPDVPSLPATESKP
jgi:hypothetical protein